MSPAWPSALLEQTSMYGLCSPVLPRRSGASALSAGVSVPGLIEPLSSAIAPSYASASSNSSDVITAFYFSPVLNTFATTGNLAIDALLSPGYVDWNTSASGGIIS